MGWDDVALDFTHGFTVAICVAGSDGVIEHIPFVDISTSFFYVHHGPWNGDILFVACKTLNSHSSASGVFCRGRGHHH